MLRHALLPILIAAAAACGGAQAEPERANAVAAPDSPPAASRSASAPASERPPITPAEVEAGELPAGAVHRGNVVGARRWTDGLGENLLILTRTDPFEAKPCEYDSCGWDQELYAYHYTRRDTGLALLWRTTDFIRQCDLDMTVRMGHQTLEITDLDADGIAETTFLYILACRGDVSAAEMKLIMHEGAEKYAIRGTMDEDPRMPDARPSQMTVDPSFNRAPAAFRTFAMAHWKKFTAQSAWPEEFGDVES